MMSLRFPCAAKAVILLVLVHGEELLGHIAHDISFLDFIKFSCCTQTSTTQQASEIASQKLMSARTFLW